MIIWGPKTVALFDVWSIEHLISGMNLYFLSAYLIRKFPNKYFSVFGLVMTVCFAWEALEHYLETGLFGGDVETWFQGVEYYLNRLVSDPLLIFAGAWLAAKYRKLNAPAKVFSICWLILHVFVFPDSMYLQRLMPQLVI